MNLVKRYDEQERLARDRSNIIAALEMTGGKVSGEQGAAKLLGIRPTTLASRLNYLGVKNLSNTDRVVLA